RGPRDEPLRGIEVEGDVLAGRIDDELALQLLLRLERGGELERGAVEGAIDEDGSVLGYQVGRAGHVVGGLQPVDLELDLVVGAGENEELLHLQYLQRGAGGAARPIVLEDTGPRARGTPKFL